MKFALLPWRMVAPLCLICGLAALFYGELVSGLLAIFFSIVVVGLNMKELLDEQDSKPAVTRKRNLSSLEEDSTLTLDGNENMPAAKSKTKSKTSALRRARMRHEKVGFYEEERRL